MILFISSLERNCVFGVEILKGSIFGCVNWSSSWARDYYSFLDKNSRNRSQSTNAVNLNWINAVALTLLKCTAATTRALHALLAD